MLTIHHLRIGRSIFTVWLLEELGIDYELIEYIRHPETMRAPPELKAVHPLGKSPVIEDDGLLLSESGAITAYLLRKYDNEGRFGPDPGNLRDWAEMGRKVAMADAELGVKFFQTGVGRLKKIPAAGRSPSRPRRSTPAGGTRGLRPSQDAEDSGTPLQPRAWD